MFKPYVFLRGLLLLAGDVETNPGPIQGRQRAASCQHSWMCSEPTQWQGGSGGGGGGGLPPPPTAIGVSVTLYVVIRYADLILL